MPSRTECVLDTSICIDLYAGQIAEVTFSLPLSFILPDLIRAELLRPSELSLAFDIVETRTLTGRQISRLYSLKQDKHYRKLSVNDLSALILAQDNRAMLMTNEKDLRMLAELHGVECHGILWILDTLVSTCLVGPGAAADALDRIIACGSWLPRDQCAKRLYEWRSPR